MCFITSTLKDFGGEIFSTSFEFFYGLIGSLNQGGVIASMQFAKRYDRQFTVNSSCVRLLFLICLYSWLVVQVSDKMDPQELVKLCEILNPHNRPGRLTIIARMGADNLRIKLPHLIRAIRQAGLIVTWVSDPMHGNTIKAPCGLKTRSFDAIRVRKIVKLHSSELQINHFCELLI